MLGVLEVDFAATGPRLVRACIARGRHAVEQIDAAFDCIKEVEWRAHAHQVARAITRQQRGSAFDGDAHLLAVFAYGHAAHSAPDEVVLRDIGHRLRAQVRERAALHDAEQSLSACETTEALVFGHATLKPTRRACRRSTDQLAIRGIRRAMVESHLHIGA